MLMRILLTVALLIVLAPSSALAFCGFYVAGGDASLFNDATQVALVRDGNRTVLSMQNNYAGPAESFAMVVPVPEVLEEGDVKTLNKQVFDDLDRLSAPRLVEYWEKNPCKNKGFIISPLLLGIMHYGETVESRYLAANASVANEVFFGEGGYGVAVEAEFAVGEYDIEVLSADDSSGLEAYLRANNYNIPDGAAPYLAPYVADGSYFFVAKVDPKRATFENGQAILSPLRFDFEAPTFKLPVRLGMINSQGEQDLVVYLIGNSRYETANYPNVQIPTNIEVEASVKESFGEFYQALFAATVEKNPGAVVTEYAWSMAAKCDPCPPEAPGTPDMASLGWQGDMFSGGTTLTRLHARYTPDQIGEDLIFQKAAGLVGGVPERASSSSNQWGFGGFTPPQPNRFQGRYIIRNRWIGPMTCLTPDFGQWGGPPKGGLFSVHTAVSPNTDGSKPAVAAGELGDWLAGGVEELGIDGGPAPLSLDWLRAILGISLTVVLMALVLLVLRAIRWKSRRVFWVVFLLPCMCCPIPFGAVIWACWVIGGILIAIEGSNRDKAAEELLRDELP